MHVLYPLAVVLGLAVIGLATLVVVTRRLRSRNLAPSGGTTETHSLDWLTATDKKPLAADQPGERRWRMTTVGSLAAVEVVLDQLQTAGFEECEVVVLGNQLFAVRWR